MTASVSTLALVAILTLALFLGFLNLAFWYIQRKDRALLWLAAWLGASAVFALCRLMQYAVLNDQAYSVVSRLVLTAGYTLSWLGYELGNNFIGYRPSSWERRGIIAWVAIPILLLWTSPWILTDKVILRMIVYGGAFHGVMAGILYLPASLMVLALGMVPPLRLFRTQNGSKQENHLMAMGYLVILLVSLSDFVGTALDLAWIRLSDFGYLPLPILFSLIQVQRFGRIYRAMDNVVHEQTQELHRANTALRAEITERQHVDNLFHLAVESAPNAIILVDRTGQIIMLNSQAENFFGYARDELLGTKLERLVPERFRTTHAIYHRSFIAAPQLRSMGMRRDLIGLRKDGSEFPAEIGLSPIESQDGLMVMAMIVDITERKLAEAELRRKADEMTALYKTTHDLVIEQDLSRLLTLIIERAAGLLGASGGGLYLCEPEPLHVRCVVSYNTPHDYTGVVLKYGEGAAGRVAETGEPLLIDDYRIWSGRAKAYEQDQPFASLLSVPLRWQERAIGVIHVFESTRVGVFTPGDLQVLTLFANQAAVAIENARLFEAEQRRRKEVENLQEATLSLTCAVEPEALYEIILSALQKLLPFDSASLELVDRDYLEIVAGRGLPESLIGRRHLNSLAKWGELNKWRAPICIANVQEDERFVKFEATNYIRGWMGVPLFARDRLLGYLNLDSRTIGFYNETHITLAQTFGNQAAIAIENMLLFKDARRRAQEAAAIAEVGRHISSSLQLDVVLDQIASHARELLQVETSAVYLADTADSTLHAVAALGPDANEIKQSPLRIGRGILGNIAQQRAGEIVNDPTVDSRAITITGTETILFEHLMGVPILSNDQLMGLIAVWRYGDGLDFQSTDLEFLNGLAQQASVALENARLVKAMRQLNTDLEQRVDERTAELGKANVKLEKALRDISVLYTISQFLIEVEKLDEAIQRISELLAVMLSFDRVAIITFDLINQQVTGYYRGGPGKHNSVNVPYAGLMEGLSGWVLRELKPALSPKDGPDLRESPEVQQRRVETNCGAIIVVPILFKAKILGTLTVINRPDQRDFTQDDVDLLMSLGNQIAAVMENNRLYLAVVNENKERQRAQTELEAANKELDAFSYSVSHDLRTPLRAIDAYTRILHEEYAAQLPADAQQYLTNILEGSKRMGRLIQDLLLLSRMTRQALQRERVDLSKIARTIAENLTTSHPERVVEFVIAENMEVVGDVGLIVIMLENLLHNAWKYSSKREAARIEFGANLRENGERVFYVRDNGAGFDMKYASKLFGAFQRLHAESEFEGMGIGLATVQRIIHKHGGQIWAESEVGKGATFYFTI